MQELISTGFPTQVKLHVRQLYKKIIYLDFWALLCSSNAIIFKLCTFLKSRFRFVNTGGKIFQFLGDFVSEASPLNSTGKRPSPYLMAASPTCLEIMTRKVGKPCTKYLKCNVIFKNS